MHRCKPLNGGWYELADDVEKCSARAEAEESCPSAVDKTRHACIAVAVGITRLAPFEYVRITGRRIP
jgi:hypothetical protein